MTKTHCTATCVGHATSGLMRFWKLFKWERLLGRKRPAIGVKYLFRFAVTLSLLTLLAVCYYSMIWPSFASAAPTRNFIASPVSITKAAPAAASTPNPFSP